MNAIRTLLLFLSFILLVYNFADTVERIAAKSCACQPVSDKQGENEGHLFAEDFCEEDFIFENKSDFLLSYTDFSLSLNHLPSYVSIDPPNASQPPELR